MQVLKKNGWKLDIEKELRVKYRPQINKESKNCLEMFLAENPNMKIPNIKSNTKPL